MPVKMLLRPPRLLLVQKQVKLPHLRLQLLPRQVKLPHLRPRLSKARVTQVLLPLRQTLANSRHSRARLLLLLARLRQQPKQLKLITVRRLL